MTNMPDHILVLQKLKLTFISCSGEMENPMLDIYVHVCSVPGDTVPFFPQNSLLFSN